MKFTLRDALVLFAVTVTACTLANLIALKIAGDQVSAKLEASTNSNPILKLFK